MDLPDTIEETWIGEHRVQLRLALEPEMSCFRGHFEGAPVLAGVIQVGWALAFAEQKFQRKWHFRGLQSAKFQRLILPPVSLQLDIQYLVDREMLKFKYSNDAGAFSSGGMNLELCGE